MRLPDSHDIRGVKIDRSDSLRSEASSRPRVSFNRDVHIKRISGGGRGVSGLAGDKEGRLHPVTLRRVAPSAEETKQLLKRAENVVCSSYSTLPGYGKTRGRTQTGSLDRRKKGRSTAEEGTKKEGNRERTRRKYSKLSPIIEKDSPWEPLESMEEPSDRIMKLINGTPAGEGQRIKAEPAPKKKKESFGQKVKMLFTKKKPKKEKEKEKEPDGTDAKGRNYTPSDNDTTDGERSVRRSNGSRWTSEHNVTKEKPSSSWFRSLDRTKAGTPVKEGSSSGRLRYFGDSEPDEPAVTYSRKSRQSPNYYSSTLTHRNGSNRGRESSEEEGTVTSHQSSVVFLHSAAVGDIPGSRRLSGDSTGKRASSREELTSVGQATPYRRTLSRSVSVLGPWGPRGFPKKEIDYSSEQAVRTLGRPPKGPQAPVAPTRISISTDRRSPVGKPKDLLFTGPSFDERYGLEKNTGRSPSGLTSTREHRVRTGKTRK